MNDEDTRAAGDAHAISVDGRHFEFSGSLDTMCVPGTLVVLRSDGDVRQLGQVEEATFALGGVPQGHGRVLGLITNHSGLDTKRTAPFAFAAMRPAESPAIEMLYSSARGGLAIGTLLTAEGIAARLLPERFNRHTFWCGQSGSGKTYALGVVLEQLLLHTRLPMVIFDPNADFVRIREPRADATDRAALRKLADRDVRILRPSQSNADGLRVRFIDMALSAKAAVLRLHPLNDRAEYNELMHFEETVGTLPPEKVVSGLLTRGTDAARNLAARIENLKLTDWSVWAGDRVAVTDILDSRPDATVLDLGGFAYPDESLVVAMAVLDDLWAKREQRRPILIVIDEAHNLCSPDQGTPLHVAVRERIIQIAAEGRKFGLWLLLSTQRPARMHASIISQCDNLALMKMTSPDDLRGLGAVFGIVPEAMLASAARFTQGEALFAGGFVPTPTLVKMGGRLTQEGGSDVAVPLRDLRGPE